ncbi:MAG: GNAT family N-acetyltransferase, partial [Desulfobacteraceae bacterium]
YKKEIASRFFHEKTRFVQDEMHGVSQIDYIKDLTVIALVGEFGFGKVVAVGEYLLDPARNMAEVAFSVIKEYQGKRLGKILLKKLSEAARENGILGLFAYTSPGNQGMIKLFQTLPYKIRTTFEDDMIMLSCRFDDPKE